MRVLLIDDIRGTAYMELFHGITVTQIATNYQSGVQALSQDGPWDLLCLDHDIASWDEQGKELTGYSVMVFLEENPQYMPKDIFFVTSNPVGRDNMQRVLKAIKARQ